jgi:hypothetical protein
VVLRKVLLPALAVFEPSSRTPTMPMKATTVAAIASLVGPRFGCVLGSGPNQSERGSKESSGETAAGVKPPDSLEKWSELNIEIYLANAVVWREAACCWNASQDAHGT